ANGMATAADWMSAATFISMAGTLASSGYDGSRFLMGWTGGFVLLTVLMVPFLRKFGKATVPDFIGDRYYSKAARLVAESVHLWIKEELTRLERGAVLTIDYGGTAEENYHRRPSGTLRAYFHHQLLYPPEAYQNPSHQDLTFDVNFEDLIAWGNEIELQASDILTQSQFCPEANLGGASEAFKVLEQTKS
ncbi:SAM-dependent methyltransferase, partial [Akkermansiaceae bacterium]|nr:SAM-dependent methyltransferase [Akkermansiaceae bacterium]